MPLVAWNANALDMGSGEGADILIKFRKNTYSQKFYFALFASAQKTGLDALLYICSELLGAMYTTPYTPNEGLYIKKLSSR